MLRTLSITVALGALLVAATAEASVLPQIAAARDLRRTDTAAGPVLMKHYVQIAPGIYQAVKGSRERRQIRTARWADLLGGDRARVYSERGRPLFRYRELSVGILEEYWIYPDVIRSYIFRGDRLVRSRRF